MSGMITKLRADQRGELNTLAVPLGISVFLLLIALGFGFWAFAERQDYKDNVDEKVAAATAVAVEKAKTDKDNEFLQKEKSPYKGYTSSAQYGSFTFQYPKTWSGYADEDGEEITLTMNPDTVSANTKSSHALKVQVINRSYDSIVKTLDGPIKQGRLSAAAYALPSVSDAVGLRVDGEVDSDKRGAAVYVPLRDKTIVITTETPERMADFNDVILKTFSFKP